MANWCTNYVFFTGSKENMKKVNKLFATMCEHNYTTNTGALPDFIEHPKQDWFFDIMKPETETDEYFNYYTKWSSNELDLIDIAKQFNLEFECEYSESGNCIFGKSTYKNGLLTNHALEYDEYIKAVPVDKESEDSGYLYKGEHYESLDEALNDILEDKINNLILK